MPFNVCPEIYPQTSATVRSQAALARGVYNERICKLCTDGVVVMGEYGLSISLMEKGYTFDTLMYKYGGVDWRDEKNWKCNNQVRTFSPHHNVASSEVHIKRVCTYREVTCACFGFDASISPPITQSGRVQ